LLGFASTFRLNATESFQLRQDQPMAAVRSVTLVKSPRRSAWRSTMEKNTF